MEYRIGFFVSDWNYEAIESFTRGVRQFLKEHTDVSVVIFNDFGMVRAHEADRGGMDIFSLPDIAMLDALMVEGDRSWPAEREEMVLGQARKRGIPIASLNCPMKGCIYVGTDNYQAEKDITIHVIREHAAGRLAFVRGQKGSLEADERERGFLDACLEEGLLPEAYVCYDGAWDMEAGMEAGRQMCRGKAPLPDAVICANDDLAVGVRSAFEEAGVKVPEDVLLTGFDNLDVSSFSDPPITTVERNYSQTAYTGMQVLYDCMQGRVISGDVYSPHAIVPRASCGCEDQKRGTLDYEGRYLRMSRHLRQLYKISDELENAMYSADRIGDVMCMFEQAAPSLGCKNIYLAVDYNYLNRSSLQNDVDPFSGKIALMAAWGEEKRNAYGALPSFADPSRHIYELFDRHMLIPKRLKREKQLLILYPLRSGDACIGYVAVEGASPLSEFNVLQLFLQLVSSCIENTQRKILTAQLFARVSEMSVRDSLTGLYNRFGLRKEGTVFCRQLYARKGYVRFFFLDMDGMKKINDTYGHEVGDQALKAMADAIASLSEKEPCFCVRFGGDEFLFITAMSHEKAEEGLRAYLDQSGFRDRLYFSLGSNLVTDYLPEQMDSYIVRADDKMYEVKRIHHAANRKK